MSPSRPLFALLTKLILMNAFCLGCFPVSRLYSRHALSQSVSRYSASLYVFILCIAVSFFGAVLNYKSLKTLTHVDRM